jgi:hypothetical protein
LLSEICRIQSAVLTIHLALDDGVQDSRLRWPKSTARLEPAMTNATRPVEATDVMLQACPRASKGLVANRKALTNMGRMLQFVDHGDRIVRSNLECGIHLKSRSAPAHIG